MGTGEFTALPSLQESSQRRRARAGAQRHVLSALAGVNAYSAATCGLRGGARKGSDRRDRDVRGDGVSLQAWRARPCRQPSTPRSRRNMRTSIDGVHNFLELRGIRLAGRAQAQFHECRSAMRSIAEPESCWLEPPAAGYESRRMPIERIDASAPGKRGAVRNSCHRAGTDRAADNLSLVLRSRIGRAASPLRARTRFEGAPPTATVPACRPLSSANGRRAIVPRGLMKGAHPTTRFRSVGTQFDGIM